MFLVETQLRKHQGPKIIPWVFLYFIMSDLSKIAKNKSKIGTTLTQNSIVEIEIDPLERYEDTKKLLSKTGVDSVPLKRIKYDKVKDYINAGSFGSVYRCKVKGMNLSDGHQIAVKIIDGAKIASSPNEILMVAKELKIQHIAQGSEYVVGIYKFSVQLDMTMYLVMEFCPSDMIKYTEKEVDKEPPKNKPELKYTYRLDTIFDRCFQGLEFIHDQGIIHRDLKPENILLIIEGDIADDSKKFREIPKICDFGISKLKSQEEKDIEKGAKTDRISISTKSKKTMAKRKSSIDMSLAKKMSFTEKTVIGTNLFMAGEMYTGQYDETVDIYALALSYFQCKTYTSARGSEHWKTPMVTPLTQEMFKNNNLTFSPYVKNYLAWPQILTEATSQRPVERPSSTQIGERLNSKYLAKIAEIGRKMGLNRKKPNFYRRLFLIFGVPLIIMIVLIVMLTLKCPLDKITTTPWKPVWFGGCKSCALDQRLTTENGRKECIANICKCTNGSLVTEARNTTGKESNYGPLLCDVDNAEKCVSCNPGYHLENEVCKLNQCTCRQITSDVSGFNVEFLEIGQNTTGLDFLPYGKNGELVTQCFADGIQSCKSCNNGYYLSKINEYNSICMENQCVCEGGIASNFNQCPFHQAKHCLSCKEEDGYYMNKIINATRFDYGFQPTPLGILDDIGNITLHYDENGGVLHYRYSDICEFEDLTFVDLSWEEIAIKNGNSDEYITAEELWAWIQSTGYHDDLIFQDAVDTIEINDLDGDGFLTFNELKEIYRETDPVTGLSTFTNF